MAAKNLNLVLHCGSNKVDREAVDNVATPAGTDSWYPIPHRSLIELIESRLPEYGLSVVQQQHALMREDHRYFGLFQIEPMASEVPAPLDYSLVLGVRNSHDKSFPAGLCLGSGVFVCDNLAFSAEVVIGRRHTRHIMDDLPRLVAAAFGKLVTARIDQDRRIEAYKTNELTDSQAAHLLFQAAEGKAVTKTSLLDVWNQWKAPNHPEFATAGKTVWRLFNAITEVSKGINPFELSNRTQRINPLFDVVCGLDIGLKNEDFVDAEFTVVGQNQLA